MLHEIYLTMDTLEAITRSECERHHVNFDYFFQKLLSKKSMPITRKQLIECLDDMLVDAFWNDYESMYKGVAYPSYSVKKNKVL